MTNQCFLKTPMAIIGMACRLPGADNLDEYWELLRDGKSAVVEMPPERLDRELYYNPEKGIRGKSYSQLGGLISNRPFDRRLCPLSDEMLESADEAHLTICEVAAEACRQAGLDPFHLPLRNTGVYIGHSGGSSVAGEIAYSTMADEIAENLRQVAAFQQLPKALHETLIREIVDRIHAEKPRREAGRTLDLAASAAASIIARAFGLTGPQMVLDAACASSLVAIALGAQALEQGRIDMAIVGGASYNKSESMILFSHAQSCSASGSRPFDAEADGLISSEGYVALLMKTLPAALAAGDTIQAVIRGIGISSDGRGRSLWAPRKEGQVEAVRRAYGPGVDCSSIQYVESHATSTKVGDATEVDALASYFRDRLPAGMRIPMGSVKANIGHTLETAGVASVVKTILAMKHGVVPPAINLKELSHAIEWDKIPFFVPTQATPWPAPAAGLPRRAAVNAFGIGGLNVHLIVDQFTPQIHARPAVSAMHRNGAAAADAEPDAVAIIGMGTILPGAQSPAEYWDLLVSGRDPKSNAPPDRWNAQISCQPGAKGPWRSHAQLGGYIRDYTYDWKKHKVPPKQVAQANPLQFMLLDAADQALHDAGYDTKPFDRHRTGVVVGTIFGGDFSNQLQVGLRLPEFERTLGQVLARHGVAQDRIDQVTVGIHDLLLKLKPALFDETGSFTSSTLASRISKTLDLMGGAMALDAGEASSMAALSVANNMLLTGGCDMILCAAAQRWMDLTAYEVMSLKGHLARQEPGAAFDSGSQGFVPGEGVVMLLLKRLSDARRDGDRIHAVIRGIGIGVDSHDASHAFQAAIENALSISGLDASEVSILEPTGTSIPATDADEVRALAATYGQGARKLPLLVGSSVAQIGNTQAVQGLAALVKATLALEHGQMPPSFGHRAPSADLAQHGRAFQTVPKAAPLPVVSQPGHFVAGVSGYSQNGSAFHVLIERGTKVALPKPRSIPTAPAIATAKMATVTTLRPARIVRIGAANSTELVTALDRLAVDPQALFAAADARRFTASDRARLAVVAEDPASLAQKLKLAREQMLRPESRPVLEEQGVYCREIGGQRPRVAFLFPGQGSQYIGMLRELVSESPAAARAMAAADASMARLGFVSFADIAWREGSAIGTDVWQTQVSMLLADIIVLAALESRGLRPDVISAQSYGEFPALVAAGAWTLEQAIRATKARCDAIDASRTAQGGMLSTSASPDVIRRLAAAHRIAAYVSNHNAPDQTVIGGSEQALAAIAARLTAEGFEARPLAVPRPFHTPLMEDVKPALGRALEREAILPPRIPLLSSVTNRYVADPLDIRANLVLQMTEPVRYVDLIERLARDGVTVFVEIGPQQVLTRLHRRILRGTHEVLIASDHPKLRTQQLDRLQALLECAGAWNEPAASPPITALATESSSATQSSAVGEFLHFDATRRRKEKLREAGASPAGRGPGRMPPASAPRETPQPRKQEALTSTPRPVAPAPRPVVSQQPVRTLALVETTRTLSPAPTVSSPAVASIQSLVAATVTKPVAPAIVGPVSNPVIVSGPAPENLEAFLINFVVEQTGYPPEIVELDADLEADLGIDSIKKAQLFGELGEYFELTLSKDLKLDNYSTLRHVLAFLRDAKGKSDWLGPDAGAASVADAASVGADAGSIRHEERLAKTPVAAAASPAIENLEAFLINFVVEQTGYPPEIVELDADLEADLGIDSIKKAQLFGELGEYFDLNVSKDLKLDDYSTLRHVLAFLRGAKGKSDWLGPDATSNAAAIENPVDAASRAAPERTVAATSPAIENLEAFLINFVVEQTGYPPEIVELDADLEADLGIDSIKKAQLFGELGEYFDLNVSKDLKLDDYPTLRHVLQFLRGAKGKSDWLGPDAEVASVADAASVGADAGSIRHEETLAKSPVLSSAAPAIENLEAFLINFVVEQTGYPPEIVELDADLEADLGIDSIKKAQLFGELGEYFELTLSKNLRLDDYPTLRHVLAFLRETTGPAAPGLTEESHPPEAPPVAPQAAESDNLNCILKLAGTPYEMGFEHGRAQSREIKTILKRIADLPGAAYENLQPSLSATIDPSQHFGPAELEELRGLADGLGIHIGNVIAHNLSLYPDYVAGCTQFAVSARRNGSAGMIHGVNEDSPLALSLPDCLARVIQVRHPENGIPHVTFSIAGQLSGLNGINARGLAVTSTLLLDRPRRLSESHGKVHSVIVKTLLEHAHDIDSAIEIVRNSPRTGAWSMCISHHPTDRLCYLEYDGESLRIENDRDLVLTTNHSLLHSPLAKVPEHSQYRLAQLQKLLGPAHGPITMPQAQAALRDRHDGARGRETTHATMNTIRRVDNQVSIVMQPAEGELWVTPGPIAKEHVDRFFQSQIADLLETPAPRSPRPAGHGHAHGSSHAGGSQGAAPAILKPEEYLFEAPREDVSARIIMRMVPLSLPNDVPDRPLLTGPAIIVGTNPVADSLSRQLEQWGHKVYRIHSATPTEQAVAEIDRIFQEQPARHLFLTSPRDAEAVTRFDGWPARREAGLMMPYWLCQRWMQRATEAGVMDEASLIVANSSGGDFGLSGNVTSAESGGMAGLLKAIGIESWVNGFRKCRIKIIDSPAGQPPDSLAAIVCRELAAPTPDTEIGYINGQRHVVRTIPRSAATLKQQEIPHGGTWVLTGGARGITAHIARELGARFGLKMHLLGTAPEPRFDPAWRDYSEAELKQLKVKVMQAARAANREPIEDWRDVERALEIDKTLREFAAAGIQATYHSCNVGDRAALARVLDRVRQIDGPIEGVIHGAGAGKDSRFDRKRPLHVGKCIGAKIDGAMALMDLTRQDPLRFFIAFGSISGRFGANGQTDYGASNDMLCKLVNWFRRQRPECASVTFDWHAWGDAGMATKPENRLGLKMANVEFMPAVEGVAHLLDELRAGAPEGEVLITYPKFCHPFAIGKLMYEAAQPKAPARATRFPLLGLSGAEDGTADPLTAEIVLDPRREPFLIEHRLQGKPILPVVIGIEALCEAASKLDHGRRVVGLREIEAVNGLRFHSDQPQTARVQARRSGDHLECALTADFCTRDGRLVDANRMYLKAQVELADQTSEIELPPFKVQAGSLQAPAGSWQPIQYPTPDAAIYHGPPLRCLREILIHDRGAMGKATVLPLEELVGGARIESWIVPSALLDACLYASATFAWIRVEAGPSLPLRFGRLRLGHAPRAGEECTIDITYRGRDGQQICFDFAVWGADGRVILAAEDYRVVLLGGR